MADIDLNTDAFLVSDSEHSLDDNLSKTIALTTNVFAFSEDEQSVDTTSADITLKLNADAFALSEEENSMDTTLPTSSVNVFLMSDSDHSLHTAPSINSLQHPDLPDNTASQGLNHNENTPDNAGPQGDFIRSNIDSDRHEESLFSTAFKLTNTNPGPPPAIIYKVPGADMHPGADIHPGADMYPGADMSPLPPQAFEFSDIDEEPPLSHNEDPGVMRLPQGAFELSDEETGNEIIHLLEPEIQSKPFYHSALAVNSYQSR